MEPFNPDKHIPDSFWSLIKEVNQSAHKLEEYLNQSSKENIVELFKIYVEAKVELVDILSERIEASEDVMDDLADSVVALGKNYYLDIYEGKRELPLRETWESLSLLSHVFDSVYHSRFNLEIWDEID